MIRKVREIVLRNFPNGIHYKDLYNYILTFHPEITLKGKTPWATINSNPNWKNPCFVRLGNGFIKAV